MLLLNHSPRKRPVNVSLADFFVDEGPSTARRSWRAYDLWKDAELVMTMQGRDEVSVDVPANGVRVFKLSEASSSRERTEL